MVMIAKERKSGTNLIDNIVEDTQHDTFVLLCPEKHEYQTQEPYTSNERPNSLTLEPFISPNGLVVTPNRIPHLPPVSRHSSGPLTDHFTTVIESVPGCTATPHGSG